MGVAQFVSKDEHSNEIDCQRMGISGYNPMTSEFMWKGHEPRMDNNGNRVDSQE
jgi:hypothetical protein